MAANFVTNVNVKDERVDSRINLRFVLSVKSSDGRYGVRKLATGNAATTTAYLEHCH